MSILTVIDTSGTQSYIFGSNRMRESIGASEIVAQATTRWVFDVIKDLEKEKGWQHNLKAGKPCNPFDEIDENKADNLQAEVIYCGGGNALILFDCIEKAKEFSRTFTRTLLEKAPNLQVIIAHSDKEGFSLNETSLQIHHQLDAVMKKVNDKKANRKLSVPLLGLAVSAQCVSSGGVAIAQPIPVLKDLAIRKGEKLPDDAKDALADKYRNHYLSAETLAKLAFAEEATTRLKREVFDNSITLEIPRELDDLGRTRDESSYIAFVHTDGNGIGERIKKVGLSFKDDRDWIKGMRKFSQKIYEANQTALQATMQYLNKHLEPEGDKWLFVSADKERFELSPKRNKRGDVVKYYFPLRPIIFGGEDVAFICDGRIALALTAFYLKKLREQPLADGEKLYARAGIAIVKAHYPFRRAYDLSEQLAKSAKDRIKAIDSDKKQVAAMDWHIAMSGLLGDLSDIRKREYTVYNDDKLNMRPVSLDERENETDDWQTWEDFEKVIREFQGNAPQIDDKEKSNWREKRNKVKALREALRNGPTATKDFLTNYRVGLLPKLTIEKKEELRKGGWDESIRTCAYFDAIEMLDLFYRMEEKADSGVTK